MISIIIPTYNNSQSLITLIDTVLIEKDNNLEIIIVDDASTDNTQKECKTIKDNRVRYYLNSKNIGVTRSRLKGIGYAKGIYIKFFDDDDKWMPKVLNKQVQCLKHQKYNFVFGNYRVNNCVDNIQYVRSLANYKNQFKKQILSQPGPFLQACLFKLSFIKKCTKYFDSGAEPSEDWDFFISLTYHEINAVYLNEIIFQWNYNDYSQSANYKKETQALEYIIKKNKQQIKAFGSNKILAQHYRILGSRFYFINDYQSSYYYYKKAFTIYPYGIKNILHRMLQFLPAQIKKTSYNYINKKII